jgi:hypothetical protein
MGRTDIYGNLKIEENNGVLIAKFKKSMKYGKLNNETLDIKEVENGIEVGGSLTEQQIIANGYKPVCEVEKSGDSTFCVYKEYDVCFVQIWKRDGEEVQEDEIWTSESETMPKFSDLERLKRDIAMVNENINSLGLSNNEALSVKEFYPVWSADSVPVEKGEKYQFSGHLYEVVQSHTTQSNWSPENQSSLWVEVVEDHAGTLEDPIPYNEELNPLWQGMILEEGKYYTQSGTVYKCTRDSGIKLTQNLADLVGHYVEQIK